MGSFTTIKRNEEVAYKRKTPWTVAHQALLSMGFSRQEYWSRLPFPSAEDLPNPGIEPASLTSPALTGVFFTTSTTWEVPQQCDLPLLYIHPLPLEPPSLPPNPIPPGHHIKRGGKKAKYRAIFRICYLLHKKRNMKVKTYFLKNRMIKPVVKTIYLNTSLKSQKLTDSIKTKPNFIICRKHTWNIKMEAIWV